MTKFIIIAILFLLAGSMFGLALVHFSLKQYWKIYIDLGIGLVNLTSAYLIYQGTD